MRTKVRLPNILNSTQKTKRNKDTEEKRNSVCGMIDKFNKKHSKMDKSENKFCRHWNHKDEE